jgi:hypothetical protein
VVCISLLPNVFHAIRIDLLVATREQDWDKVRELDRRMADLVDRSMDGGFLPKIELAREINRNMQLYKYVLQVSARPDLFANSHD